MRLRIKMINIPSLISGMNQDDFEEMKMVAWGQMIKEEWIPTDWKTTINGTRVKCRKAKNSKDIAKSMDELRTASIEYNDKISPGYKANMEEADKLIIKVDADMMKADLEEIEYNLMKVEYWEGLHEKELIPISWGVPTMDGTVIECLRFGDPKAVANSFDALNSFRDILFS